MLLAVGIYWIGLSGPFLLDDPHALAVVRAWLKGEHSLKDVLFGNGSWLTNRALAMGSFAIIGKVGGFDPFGFKLANLLLHLAIGAVAYALLHRLLRFDQALSSSRGTVALLVSGVWLLHPLHASTVLYAVQQMAQWAALLCLLGLLQYAHLRERMARDPNARAWPTLFVAIPLTVLVGIQGKQNAALIPTLCLVVELAYFRSRGEQWPRSLKTFFGAFVAAPIAIALVVAAIKPELLPGEYGLYDFSPWQRLITEARVLCDYVGQILLPHTPSMGVFTDGYAASRNLLQPPSTLISIVALAAMSAVACRLKASHPSLFAGWFFFLAAHGVESTILPLELYYEHRNYLPSLGILLGAASIISLAASWLSGRNVRTGRVGLACGIVLLITLALLTHGRAKVWSNPLVLYESELRHHPDSAYALISYAGTASDVGDSERAYQVLNNAIATSPHKRLRGQALLFKAHLDCIHGGQARHSDLKDAVRFLPSHIDITTFNLLNLLSESVDRNGCGEISRPVLADAIRELTARAKSQQDDALVKYSLRNNAARLFSKSGRWNEAIELARQGWQTTTPAPAAVVLVEALLIQGDTAGAQSIISQAFARSDANPKTLSTLQELNQLAEEERISPGTMRRRAEVIVLEGEKEKIRSRL